MSTSEPSGAGTPPIRTSTVGWSLVLAWYCGALALCVIGALLHDKLLALPIWTAWAATRYDQNTFHFQPLWSDIGRAVTGFVLSLIALRWLDVIPESVRRKINGKVVDRPELCAITAAITAALFVAYYVLPANFFIECTSLVANGAIKRSIVFSFTDIWKSYLFYSPYVIGLWVGMVFPVFFFFVRSIRHDFKTWNGISHKARKFSDRFDAESLSDVWRLWGKRYLILKDVACHYVSVFSFVIVLVILEAYLFHFSATEGGDKSGYVALGLMLLPASVISAVVFTSLYAKERARTELWLRDFIERCDDPILEENANGKLKDLENFSDLNFLWAVLSSRGFILVFCFGLVNVGFTNAMPVLWKAFSGLANVRNTPR